MMSEPVEIYRQVAASASRYHGPYRLVGRLDGRPRAGETATGTLRLLAASGAAVP